MPKDKPISQILREIVPHGSSCYGCRYLYLHTSVVGEKRCSMLNKPIEADKKICGINEGEG